MKREGMLFCLGVFLIGIFLIKGVSAACVDSDRIMKLYQSTNSHGALYDYGGVGYTYDICYSDIFGTSYTGGDFHTCVPGDINPDNVVLWLAFPFNSHASTTSRVWYTTPVCYGDLECTSRIGSCVGDEEIVVRLYSDSNSHISDRSDNNYNILICCRSENKGLDEVYFADMLGNKIAETGKSSLVKLVVAGRELLGESMTYEVFKDVSWWFDREVAVVSGSGFVEWRAGYNQNDGSLEAGDYYFIATIESTGETKDTRDNANPDYQYLNVSDTEVNNPPFVNITSPIDRQIYFVDELLNFNQTSYDEDDHYNYTWDLGDGTIRQGNSTAKENFNFTYAYSGENAKGQKDIFLIATDERGAKAAHKISILIINSSYFLAYIDFPKWWETVNSNIVEFNGSGSYAVNVTTKASGEREIICLAGDCPSPIEGCPPDYLLNPLLDCPITIPNTPQPFDGLNFTWIFDNNQTTTVSIMGDAGKIIKWLFVRAGLHTARLIVNSSSETTVDFYAFFERPSCGACPGFFGDYACWYDNGNINPTTMKGRDIEDNVSCYNPIGVSIDDARDQTECCPSGWECDTAEGVCKIDVGVEELYCAKYNGDEGGCINGHQEALAFYEADEYVDCAMVESWTTILGENCINWTSCYCEYLEGQCYPAFEYRQNCTDGSTTIEPRCIIIPSFDDSRCEDTGFMEKTITFEWEGPSDPPPSCRGVQVIHIPCQSAIKLDFFNIFNFIIAVLIIIGVYYFSNKKK